MTVSISSAIRLSAYLFLGSCFAAIGIGKMCGPSPILRSLENVRLAHIPSITISGPEEKPSLVDLKTGVLFPFALPQGEILEWASCSPWHDELDQRQIAGHWSSRSGEGESKLATEFGLARFNFPDGKPLNRIPSEITPMSAPCWYPGTTAKILFAAGDGTLYRFDSEIK